MATDGHTGIDRDEMIRTDTESYSLVLVRLLTANEGDRFIIHASTKKPEVFFRNFLRWIGFQERPEPCPHQPSRRCYWRPIATTLHGAYSRSTLEHSMRLGFNGFVNKVENLVRLRRSFDEVLATIQADCEPLPIFREPVDI